MVDEIGAAPMDAEADDSVGALVVTGTAPAFCAGADLSHLGDSQREGLLRIYEGFLRIGRSPLPSIAAVNGAAVGAGVNIALACDVIVAGESARFDTRFLQLGIHPGGGHTWMLQRRIGAQAAAAMVLFGATLDGPRRPTQELAGACEPDGELLTAAGRGCRAPRRRLASWSGASRRRLSSARHDTTKPCRARLDPSLVDQSRPSREDWRRCSAASAQG